MVDTRPEKCPSTGLQSLAILASSVAKWVGRFLMNASFPESWIKTYISIETAFE